MRSVEGFSNIYAVDRITSSKGITVFKSRHQFMDGEYTSTELSVPTDFFVLLVWTANAGPNCKW
jgi:hypothetical protein